MSKGNFLSLQISEKEILQAAHLTSKSFQVIQKKMILIFLELGCFFVWVVCFSIFILMILNISLKTLLALLLGFIFTSIISLKVVVEVRQKNWKNDEIIPKYSKL
ncbi:hypothetical protein [Roseofilum sp. Guam]|uniref:hypothetical protein n=1 Tax=Roseofilum sp. Guam TaxID=2821502 RepID=UPI001B2797E0|nr:hypothetical protein [Roseofilum sp. Guam]MBP0027500.1 hypothetical protein [Roseofilum sp. Guam]